MNATCLNGVEKSSVGEAAAAEITRAGAALPRIALGFLLAHLCSYGLVNTLLVVGLLVVLLDPTVRARSFRGWPEASGYALLGFLAWVLASMLFSPETWVPGAELAPRFSLKPPMALLLGFAVARVRPGSWDRALSLLSAGLALFVLPCLVTFMRGTLDRMYVTYTYGREIIGPNPLGGMCTLMLLLLVARRWRTRVRLDERLYEWPVMALLLAGLLATGSRSSLVLAVGMSFGFALWTLRPAHLARYALGLVLGLGVVVAVNPRFVPKLDGGFLGYEMNLRFLIWKRGFEMIQRHPLTGTGARRYRDAADQYLPTYSVSRITGLEVPPEAPDAYVTDLNPDELHSDYMTVTAVHGFPGLALWVLVHLAFLHAAWCTRSRPGHEDTNPEREALAAGTFGFVLGALGYQLFNGIWYNQALGPFSHFFVGSYLGEEASARDRGSAAPGGDAAASRAGRA